MYYYIFDPPTGAKEYERTAQIKELLASLGIAGEISQPQPGKSAEDLVHNAIAKRYSTIVAVGGMELINRIARALEPYDVVFGIIPTIDHPDIATLIGTSEWKPAAEQLKRRRWQYARLGVINDDIYFLTPAYIDVPSGSAYSIQTPDFTAMGRGGLVELMPLYVEGSQEVNLSIKVQQAKEAPRGILQKLFSRDSAPSHDSYFSAPTVTIQTEQTLSVTVAGTAIITTPIQCTTKGKQLRLIVARGNQS